MIEFDKELDEIVEKLFSDTTKRTLSNTEGGRYHKTQAVEAIKQAIEKHVIGENEGFQGDLDLMTKGYRVGRDKLRAEQRQKLNLN